MRKTPYSASQPIPTYQVRASYDETTIRVYQAYSIEIAEAALRGRTFVSPPFSMTRMTWIKPSFLWMMYRCGWAQKVKAQARVLAVDISRKGFEWALENAWLSHCPTHLSHEEWRRRKDAAPAVVQWDPEKDIFLQPLAHRAIQIGIGGVAVEKYVNSWIREITDITEMAREIEHMLKTVGVAEAVNLLPNERAYPAIIDSIVPIDPGGSTRSASAS
jgi:hypothetical protein